MIDVYSCKLYLITPTETGGEFLNTLRIAQSAAPVAVFQ